MYHKILFANFKYLILQFFVIRFSSILRLLKYGYLCEFMIFHEYILKKRDINRDLPLLEYLLFFV